MPERPAVASCGALNFSRHFVNRALGLSGDHGAVGAYLGGPASRGVEQHVARLQQSAFDQGAKRHAWLAALLRRPSIWRRRRSAATRWRAILAYSLSRSMPMK